MTIQESDFREAGLQNLPATLLQEMEDRVDALESIGTGTASKPFGNLSAWYDAPAANMTAGVENNFVHPNMLTHVLLSVRGADNNGTTLTGLDSTGITAGMVRVLLCTSTSEEDVGNITFKHEDSASLAQNRFMCPGHYDYTQPIYGCTMLIYGDDNRWHILSNNGYSKRALIQSLQLYPHIQVGTAAAPLTGTLNDWEPTGEVTFGGMGIAGSDLDHKTHSYWRVYSDGASVTGIEGGWSGLGGTIDASDLGAVKVIKNFGPGQLTIKHLGAGSQAQNLIRCPGDRDLVLEKGDAVWLIKAWYSGPDEPTNPQYSVIATSFNRESFPNVITTGRATLKNLTLGPQVEPSALAAGLTSDWSPGTGAVITVAGTAPCSWIDGLVPDDPVTGNEIRIIRNKGTCPIFLLDELSSASTATNRISCPRPGMSGAVTANSPLYALLSNQEVVLQYQPTLSRWVVMGAPSILKNAHGVIQPAVLAGANVNNYNPTDSISSLQGRFAYWWQIQGSVGTNLTGIEAAPAGLPPFVQGDEIMLTNLGSGMTIKDFDANSSIANRFRLPGGDIVLPTYGCVTFRYSGLWILVQKT